MKTSPITIPVIVDGQRCECRIERHPAGGFYTLLFDDMTCGSGRQVIAVGTSEAEMRSRLSEQLWITRILAA